MKYWNYMKKWLELYEEQNVWTKMQKFHSYNGCMSQPMVSYAIASSELAPTEANYVKRWDRITKFHVIAWLKNGWCNNFLLRFKHILKTNFFADFDLNLTIINTVHHRTSEDTSHKNRHNLAITRDQLIILMGDFKRQDTRT